MSFESRTLKTGNSELIATTLGAGLLGWRVDKLNLLKPVGTAAGNWTDLASFVCGPNHHGRLFAPNGTPAAMNFDGKIYQLDASAFVNVDANRSFANPAIHGYWPNQIWTVDKADQERVVLLKSGTPESPFPVTGRVEYKMTTDRAFTCTTSAYSQKQGPHGCCHHPAFSLDPAGLGAEQVTIKIPAAIRRWPKDQQQGCLLINGMPLEDLGGLDLVNGTPVVGGWDDQFLLDGMGTRMVELAYTKARIKIQITFSRIVRHVILCSPPGCNFIYIEPCVASGNAVNLAAMGLPGHITGHRVIEANESHQWWWKAELIAA